MILKRIRIGSFGCLTGREISFKEGLNVILGPNEAGKSTVFYAIQRGLFTPSRLKKRDFEREIERFIPVDGGDTVSVELEFTINGRPYRIRRSWGGRAGSELILPGGGSISDDERIRSEMEGLLPAKEGTFRSVLMTYQTGLHRTIDEIGVNRETIHQLGDILRILLYETDGVSIERFKEQLNSLYHQYFSHWDVRTDHPEKGRGIENPWSKEVGEILKAFYRKEDLGKALKEAREYEDSIDRLNRELSFLEDRLSKCEDFLKANRKAYNDANHRERLNARKDAKERELKELRSDYDNWTRYEEKRRDIATTLSRLSPIIEPLEKEYREAKAHEENRRLLERFERIKRLKVDLEKEEKALSSMIRLRKEDLQKIKKAARDLSLLEERLRAGRLTVRIRATTPLTLNIETDLQGSRTETVEDEKVIEAGGLIGITHPEWGIEIASGRGDIHRLKEEIHIARKERESLLQAFKVRDVEEAEEANRLYEERLKKIEDLKGLLREELSGNSYQDLERCVRKTTISPPKRPSHEIYEELLQKKAEGEKLKNEFSRMEEELKRLKERYGTQEELFLNVGKAMAEKDENRKGNQDPLSPARGI